MLSFFVDLKHNPAKWQLYALNHTRIRKEGRSLQGRSPRQHPSSSPLLVQLRKRIDENSGLSLPLRDPSLHIELSDRRA